MLVSGGVDRKNGDDKDFIVLVGETFEPRRSNQSCARRHLQPEKNNGVAASRRNEPDRKSARKAQE